MKVEAMCPNCFAKNYSGRCNECGYIGISEGQNHMLLAPGTILYNTYIIGRTLGAGGFGITYLAKHMGTNGLYAIKEYLPSTLAVRDMHSKQVTPSNRDNDQVFQHGLRLFQKESAILKQFAGNPSVVQVIDCFQQNGTAYFVMEFLDGVNLKALARSMGGQLAYELAYEVLVSVAYTLEVVHAKGLLHRDVSPENIYITKSGQIKLIDFGATRYFVGEKSRSLSVILKPGFAPPEQYSSKGNQGEWTDIYGLCATFYTVVTGKAMPDAPDRMNGASLLHIRSIVPKIEPPLANAIEKGLALNYRERFQSVGEFLQAVENVNYKAVAANVAGDIKGTPFIQLFSNNVYGDKWIIPKNMNMTIGRASDRCNIVLDSITVSRIHCAIKYDEKNSCFYLFDSSANGTYLGDGTRLEKNILYTLLASDTFYVLNRETSFIVGVE